jgi:predicted HNH restriction endonuclease
VEKSMATNSDFVKFKDLISEKDRFYIMHMSYGNNYRRKELWNFALQKKIIGLDHSDVDSDWPTIREQARKRISGAWSNQFDMLCENMSRWSMDNGDIVVIMAGKDYVLGIAKVIGPHKYNLDYRKNEQFFDHVRPVEWILEYDYEKRQRITRIEKFDRTVFCIDRKDVLWSLFSNLKFEFEMPLTVTPSTMSDVDNLKGLAEIQTEMTKEVTVVNRYKRSRELANRLKQLYGYRCQLCSLKHTNIPEIPMKDGSNYVEVHHIKGFNEVTDMGTDQEVGEYIIDTYKNAITVCVYHHKLLHKHKNEFSYDPAQKCYVSRDGSTKIPLILNKHL